MSEERLADRGYTGIVQIIDDDALVRLASDGITEARRGAGSFVKRRPSGRLGAHMPVADLAATLGTYEVRSVRAEPVEASRARKRSAR